MRRKDREVADMADIIEIMARCDVCRLAFAVENIPYIVPMNFGMDYQDDRLTLFFHSAKSGKKLDMLAANPSVCFEMDGQHHLVTGEKACDYSMTYESIIGYGKLSVCDEKEEKIHGLRQLMINYGRKENNQFSENALNSVTVLKLDVEKITGKRHHGC